ncbi:nicotinate-nicotinamide nucleotide adenylyltransferase [bacterium]|nr:nicotinate-nicotinamide nucleotide adenylyltransferase [bacterium]
MKIAVVGGTFDPFHNGHLAVCEAVSALADVDRVLVVPARQSPLKEGETGAPGPARLAMAAAAVAHLPKCEVSDLELSRPGPSFTIDTLEELSRRHPGDQVALVIGADQWPIFHTWKDYDKIGG